MSCMGLESLGARARVIALAIALAAIGCGAARAAAGGEAATVVRVDGGDVRGAAASDVIAFKGIPYAKPPLGALRWRAPQPLLPWEGVRDASAFSADPLQPAGTAPPSAGLSEDCLYLNVWRPRAAAEKPLPVMVWIYGGGLVRGGASLYPGDQLARRGIVVVTFNYRVGRLGFFAHPALAQEAPDELRGNYGYMDQLAALAWVRRNIAAFGGDPENVTIAGESAGGGSVLVLLTSPLARGLFQRAIVESAGIPSARAGASPMRALAAAESIAVEYARGLGIVSEDAAALTALRAVRAETLASGVGAYVAAILGGPEVPGLAHSIVDGRLVVQSPEAALRAGEQATVPVLVGANDADLASSPARTKDGLFAMFGALGPKARKLYDPNAAARLDDLVQAIVSDQAMVEPSRHLAEAMSRAGQPAYLYRFSYVAESQRGKVPGATHGVEIVYAFDLVSALGGARASKVDVDMGHVTSGYWSAFVKSGDPNGDGRPRWPRYDPDTREVLSFTNDGVVHGRDPLAERLDLWRDVWERGR